jgi:hypothetical protein
MNQWTDEEVAELERVRVLIEARGRVPADLFRRMLPMMADKSNRALLKAEQCAATMGEAEWRDELRMLRFTWEKGFLAYIERAAHDHASDPGNAIITPENYLKAWEASPTGSDAEIAKRISTDTGKQLTRQAVRNWRKRNPHLARLPKK